MNFTYLDEILPELANLQLVALTRDSQPYSVLLLQHEGTLVATEHRIGNHVDVSSRFRKFLQKAKADNADLVVTPEYSCPWNCISELISDESRWPGSGKLWVLGCESITKGEIEEIEQKYLTNESIIYYYEKGVLTNEKNFLDPLVYAFKTNIEGIDKLVIVIQFKTTHMGAWGGGVIERDNLIQGSNIYVIRNNPNSICLFTLICSEAINFNHALTEHTRNKLHWDDTPFLILNPQANPDPINGEFIAFRKLVFNTERKEIINLNWNVRSKIGNTNLLRDNTSRSGFYLRSHEVDQKNLTKLKTNHNLGLYHFFYGVDKFAFILNSSPQIFSVDIPHVAISGVQAPQRRRDGPVVREVAFFNDAGDIAPAQTISDGFADYLGTNECTSQFLLEPANCLVEKERLVCLSSGTFLGRPNQQWYEISNLSSIRLDEATETSRRVTISEDQRNASVEQRIKYIDSIIVLDTKILPDKSLYPHSIADLKTQELQLGYNKTKNGQHKRIAEEQSFRFNLVSKDNDPINATICYIGRADDATAAQTFNTIQGLFDHDNSMSRRRVVVFFTKGQTIHHKFDTEAASFLQTDDYTGSSILK